MIVWNKNYILNFENPEVADLYFEALKRNQSFAKTTVNIIGKLNNMKSRYNELLEDYKKTYNSIKDDDTNLLTEQTTKLYTDYLKYSKSLERNIQHIDFLKFEVYNSFESNQTQILENFSKNPEKYSEEQIQDITKTSKDLVALHSRFTKTKRELAEAMQEEPVTLDDVMFYENRIDDLNRKMQSFPFLPEKNYDEMIAIAEKINKMQFESEPEKE